MSDSQTLLSCAQRTCTRQGLNLQSCDPKLCCGDESSWAAVFRYETCRQALQAVLRCGALASWEIRKGRGWTWKAAKKWKILATFQRLILDLGSVNKQQTFEGLRQRVQADCFWGLRDRRWWGSWPLSMPNETWMGFLRSILRNYSV